MKSYTIFGLKCAAERQQYFGDSVTISDLFQDCENLLEFPVAFQHLPCPLV